MESFSVAKEIFFNLNLDYLIIILLFAFLIWLIFDLFNGDIKVKEEYFKNFEMIISHFKNLLLTALLLFMLTNGFVSYLVNIFDTRKVGFSFLVKDDKGIKISGAKVSLEFPYNRVLELDPLKSDSCKYAEYINVRNFEESVTLFIEKDGYRFYPMNIRIKGKKSVDEPVFIENLSNDTLQSNPAK